MIDTSPFKHDGFGDCHHNSVQVARRKLRNMKESFQRAVRSANRLKYLHGELSDKKGELSARIRSHIYMMLTINGRRPLPKHFEDAYAVNWFAASRYKPRPYRGSITLFQASSGEVVADSELEGNLGWKSMATDGLDVHEVAGTHRDILQEPNFQRLAQKITACLTARYSQQ
jgi:hypothetical protein